MLSVKSTILAGWISLIALVPAASADEFKLGIPVQCEIGRDCFIQQLPDLQSGTGAADPYCGPATYDGHKGTDIRVRSMADIAKAFPVIAARDGIVRGTRDGMPDQLIRTQKERAAINGRECGNGVLVSHENGYETQYCHLKNGSVSVRTGDPVRAGDTLGLIGASGLVQFPHLHLEVRRNGRTVDPFTAKSLEENCGDNGQTLWNHASVFKDRTDAVLLSSGLASKVIAHDQLVETGGPPQARPGEDAIVGWGWFINLKKGDRISMRLTGPAGLIGEHVSEPLERNKADWSGYTGKRMTVQRGRYTFETTVIRNGKPLRKHERAFTVE